MPRVQAPDGRTWVVRRRWAPWLGRETPWQRFHRRFRQTVRRADLADVGDAGCLVDVGEGLVVGILVVLAVLLAAFVVLPLVVALVELVGLLLLLALAVPARVVLRRPWTVEARAGDGGLLRWRVSGWRASGERCAEVAQLLASGVVPAPDLP
jgi:hypothetical protein